MKYTRLLAAALMGISMISLASCGSKENEINTITVTDMLGDSITIEKNPEKVACVSRTTYDLLVAFGLGDKIDGAYTSIYDNPWTEVIYPKSKNEYSFYLESFCVVNRYEPLFLKKEEKKWYNSDVSLETEP